MADEPAWLPGPLETGSDSKGRQVPGLKARFRDATTTGGGDDDAAYASMSIDTEKRRDPGGRRNYGNKNYHQWETEKGNPLAGPRRAGPTEKTPPAKLPTPPWKSFRSHDEVN